MQAPQVAAELRDLVPEKCILRNRYTSLIQYTAELILHKNNSTDQLASGSR